MSLQGWLENNWLVKHRTSAEEIASLFAIVERDLSNSQVAGLSPDWRLNIAYNAALQAASAALAAAGFRAAREQHHYRTIQSLGFTLSWTAEKIGQFDNFRKKRNIGGYESAGLVSEQEAGEMRELALALRNDVLAWLRKNYPKLLRR